MRKLLLLLVLFTVGFSNISAQKGISIGILESSRSDVTTPISTDSFKVEITTIGASESFTFPFYNGGSYNGTINFGDGGGDFDITAWNDADATNIYAVADTYEITISGTIGGINVANGATKTKFTEITQWGTIQMVLWNFWGCPNMTITATDIPDFTNTTSFVNMFRSCTSITTIPNIDSWDTSTITSMGSMFFLTTSFNQDIDAWDVGAVTDMASMFRQATSFNQSIDSWDVSNVTLFNDMFRSNPAFNQSLNSWDVSSGTNFTWMFFDAGAFNGNVTGWTFKATGSILMFNMFRSAPSFDQDLSGWNVSQVSNLASFMLSAGVSTANYDALLPGWDAQSLTASVSADFGSSTYTKSQADSGTTDGTTSSKLIDSSQNFLTTVSVNDIVHNTTDGTYAKVTAVDSDISLSLNADIMISGEAYQIETSAAVKAKENMINSDSWTILDGGGV